MNKKNRYFITFALILAFITRTNSQDLTLKIFSKNKIENSFLSKIKIESNYKNSKSINDELKKVQKRIQINGYFLSSLDSIKINETKYSAYFTLNQKIDSVVLKHIDLTEILLQKLKLKKNNFKVSINNLEKTLNKISKAKENSGNSFSKIKLKNFKVIGKVLFTEIDIEDSDKRKINKLIFNGYNNFPNNFIKNYFNINNTTIFNRQKLNTISKLSQNLNFASEKKPPEILFTKDSTFAYIYLKKRKGNSFDGLVNFSSKENGKIKFNGYLDLKLINTLNKGESLNLVWNSFGQERQEFSIATKTPYIFNTKVSPELKFSIYKQDSTFLNTNFNLKLKYQIKNNSNLFLSYYSESSEKIATVNFNNIETFESSFIGFGYQNKIKKGDAFKNDKFYLDINPSIGKRNSNNNSFKQIKIESTISYILDLNKRNSLFLRNKTGLLNSENYIENELYRIGGNNSIRGFSEQSIFAKNYVLQNIEYRYLTTKNSFLYSITDLALISTANKKEKLLSIGLGYLFNTNNSQINISVTNGFSNNTEINVNNTQLFINWINFF